MARTGHDFDMLTPSNAPATALLRVTDAPAAATRTFEAGQVLEAIARTGVRNDGRLSLQIGQQVLQARTEQPVEPGQRLQVQVLRQNSDTLTLRILSPERGNPARDAMREHIGRQGNSAGLLANASYAANRTDGIRALPEPVQAALRQIWQAVPDRTQVSQPEGLRQAVADSGLQLERRLAAVAAGSEPPAVIRSDHKAQLANLLKHVFQALDARPRPGGGDSMPPPGAQTRASPPPPPQLPTLAGGGTMAEALTDLARQGDGSLARLQLNQLALLTGDALPLFFELPVRDGQQVDLLQFRMEQQDGGEEDEDGERTWRVMVSFNFERLGPMHAVIHLSPEAVSATWWAEQPGTARFLERHLESLGERLEALGLRVASLSCAEGKPPAPEQPAAPAPWQGVVDEQA